MANQVAFGLGAALVFLLIILSMTPFVKNMFGEYLPNRPYATEGFFGAGQSCREGGPDGVPCPEGFFCNQSIDASGHRTRNGSCQPIYM
jgi:hypothetical protein